MSDTGEQLASAWFRTAGIAVDGAASPGIDRLWSDIEAEKDDDASEWREQPVGLLEFSEKFLGRDRLSDFHRDFYAAYQGDDPAVWDERFRLYVLAWGLGAGKGFGVETAMVWTLYRLMLLRNPHKFFGLAEGSWIDLINISFVNHEQAKRIFFERLKQIVRLTRDPATGLSWFGSRGIDLREHGVGDLQETVIEFPRRVRCRCLPFTSTAFEGGDNAGIFCDESSRTVGSPADNKKAHDLLPKLIDNVNTRFGRRGKIMLFSYPSAAGDEDLTMKCFNQAGTQFTARGRQERTGEKIQPSWYGSRGATWEVNPRRSYHDFDEERRNDPEGVQTRIDVNPPVSRTTFCRAYPGKIAQSFCLDARRAVFGYEVVPLTYEVQSDGRLETRTYTGIRLLWADGDDEYRALGGDPGEKSDIFALALGRTEPAERSVETLCYRRERADVHGLGHAVEQNVMKNFESRVIDRRVVVDGIAEITPIPYTRTNPDTGRPETATYPISFVSVRDFIVQLKKHFPNLRSAAFDHWESIELIEELIAAGIDAKSLAFTAREQFALYSQWRSLAYNDMIQCLPSPTRAPDGRPRAEAEFSDLQEVRPGVKVDHPDGGSKDTADSIVIVTNLALELSVSAGRCRIYV